LIFRRRFLWAGGATLLCRPAAAIDRDTLVVRAPSDIAVLDPAFQDGGLEEVVGRALFVSLNRMPDMREGSEGWMLYAARSLNVVSATAIAFTLEDWLCWTGDFGPVTAEDVKFSFERVADPAMQSPWAYGFEAMDRVEVTGTRSGIIHLKSPYQPFLRTATPWYMGHVVSHKAVLRAGGRFGTDVPASAGPYVIEKWVPQQRLVLGPNANWKGPPPEFSKIRFEIVGDEEAAALAYEAKALEYTKISLNALVYYRRRRPADTTLIQTTGNRFVWITINLKNPKFGDERVRRALQYALDVGQVMEGAYSGLAEPATGVIPPGMIGHRANILYPADPARARALLAAAGAENLTVELAASRDKTNELICEIVQALLGAVGVRVDIKTYDYAVYETLGDKSCGDGWKKLELVLMQFVGGADPSENLTWFRPEQVGVYNWSQFDSAAFETLYQQGAREADPVVRDAIYRKMQDVMEQSGGFIFLTHEVFAALARTGLDPCILADGHIDPARFTSAQKS